MTSIGQPLFLCMRWNVTGYRKNDASDQTYWVIKDVALCFYIEHYITILCIDCRMLLIVIQI